MYGWLSIVIDTAIIQRLSITKFTYQPYHPPLKHDIFFSKQKMSAIIHINF